MGGKVRGGRGRGVGGRGIVAGGIEGVGRRGRGRVGEEARLFVELEVVDFWQPGVAPWEGIWKFQRLHEFWGGILKINKINKNKSKEEKKKINKIK